MYYIIKKNLSNKSGIVCLVILSFVYFSVLSSCTSAKNLRYFNNLSDSQLVQLPGIKKPEPVIMPDDVLDIRITGANEATVATINSHSGNTSTNTTKSYLVDLNGMIEFPLIGKVKAAGLTRDELKSSITEKVTKYLRDPLVSVQFVNFRFTVLGEVNGPGTFVVNNERVTVLEGLGMARDMTQYAKRQSVRVIRDSSGVRHIGVINFNDKSVFTSPYYYLQRNDVVYVEPEKNKGRIDQATRIGSIVATVVSVIAVGLTIFR